MIVHARIGQYLHQQILTNYNTTLRNIFRLAE